MTIKELIAELNELIANGVDENTTMTIEGDYDYYEIDEVVEYMNNITIVTK